MKKVDKALEQAPSQGIVMNYPNPPAMNVQEFLGAYSGYAYTAISAIAQEVASIDMHLYSRKFVRGQVETEEVTEHEALSLLQYTNPVSTFYDLVEATQIYMELVGECFWAIVRDKSTKQPREIWLLRPDWVKIIPSKDKFIDSYVYTPGGLVSDQITLPTDSVIPFKYFNPLNPYRGKGSIQAAAMALDIYNFAQDWNRRFFYNSATPGLVFTTEKAIDEKVLKRFIQGWQENYGGRANSHKAAFLTGGFKLDKTSTNAKDMDFTEQQKQMRDDVLAIFKVPKTIIGLTDDVNKANAEATTRSFMERVITPRMIKFVNVLNEMYLPMFKDSQDLFLDFTDPSPEDVEQELKVIGSGLGAGGSAAWMTPNEVRALRNLPPIDGGDVLPTKAQADGLMKEVEASTIENKAGKSQKGKVGKIDRYKLLEAITGRKKHMVTIPTKKLETIEREHLEKELTDDLVPLLSEMLRYKADGGEKANKSWTEDKRIAYWREFEEQLDINRAKANDITSTLFDGEEVKTLENLELVKYWVADRRKGKEGSVLPMLRVMNGNWEKQLMPFIRETIKEAGNNAFTKLGLQQEIDTSQKSVVEFVGHYEDVFIKEVNKQTREHLAGVIAKGFEAGDNITKIRESIKGFFNGYVREVNDKLIAKEVLRITNFAILEAYKQSGIVQKKEWLTQKDSQPHSKCDKLDGKSMKLFETFIEKSDSIEDDVLYPPHTNDCKCTIIPVIKEAKK